MERKGLRGGGRIAQDATFTAAYPGHAPAKDLRCRSIDTQIKRQFLDEDEEGEQVILRVQAACEG
jgi:hypothetical protein